MPNGDPTWHLTELPKLERFFAPLAEEIQKFAATHNMHIDRYYHDLPDWDLCFTPPQGGDAAIDIRRVDDDTFMLHKSWSVCDYDAATKYDRVTDSPKYRVGDVSLTAVLGEALAEILSWRAGEWTHVAPGYEEIWHKHPRKEIEGPRWPKVRIKDSRDGTGDD